MTPCAVPWCCAMALTGAYCVVHARHRDLRPAELAADEELVPPEEQDPDCEACDGTGQVRCMCLACGDEHQHDCEACEGQGTLTVRKKQA